ncbi:MAG: tRNA epoxyqueuosine(34) reductase QueG [Bacteroidota bacterium]
MAPGTSYSTQVAEAIRKEALRLGFTACGFSEAAGLDKEGAVLTHWLAENMHAGMTYMANNFEKRTDPTLLVEGAKTVISLLLNYYSPEKQKDPDAPVLSKYAWGTDYHEVMKNRLRELYRFIEEHFGPVNGRIFTDSAPVMEKAWAQRAGLGWIGRNGNLINRKAGSFVFIGEIILDLELPPDRPESDFCGSCDRCIEACPTGAINSNRTIAAHRCISYNTIELKGEIEPSLSGRFMNRVFGCDICQDVCPWNRKAQPHTVEEFGPRRALLELSKNEWYTLDEDRYRSLFSHSAVKRARYEGLRRNLEFLKGETPSPGVA